MEILIIICVVILILNVFFALHARDKNDLAMILLANHIFIVILLLFVGMYVYTMLEILIERYGN